MKDADTTVFSVKITKELSNEFKESASASFRNTSDEMRRLMAISIAEYKKNKKGAA